MGVSVHWAGAILGKRKNIRLVVSGMQEAPAATMHGSSVEDRTGTIAEQKRANDPGLFVLLMADVPDRVCVPRCPIANPLDLLP